MRSGQARKRDSSEAAIVDALRAVGVIVLQISGEDVPDLALFHVRTGWLLAEVKSEKGELTEGQAELQKKAPFPVWRSVSEALEFFNFFTEERAIK